MRTGNFRRLGFGLAALAVVVAGGTVGYVILGFGVLDAVYQTITTVTTVGFRELHPLTAAGKVFTIFVIILGTGTALYTFGALIQGLIEGEIREVLGRRRMDQQIARMSDHVIICGWGRVGRVIAQHVSGAGQSVVVVDRDPDRIALVDYPSLQGDATDDAVLERAGIGRARVLVAALSEDADNVYVTISGRALNADMFIIARARVDSSHDKLTRAGADRVVNPQRIGGARMAAFALQPHVAEFLDVVMHDGSLEFRLEEVQVPARSPLAGQSLRDAHIRDRTGALVLAVREDDGAFTTNPAPETIISPGHILIAIGTSTQLRALASAASGH